MGRNEEGLGTQVEDCKGISRSHRKIWYGSRQYHRAPTTRIQRVKTTPTVLDTPAFEKENIRVAMILPRRPTHALRIVCQSHGLYTILRRSACMI